jgi:hypothetical protein
MMSLGQQMRLHLFPSVQGIPLIQIIQRQTRGHQKSSLPCSQPHTGSKWSVPRLHVICPISLPSCVSRISTPLTKKESLP